jgi:sterol desaturase/sphingolipid hydroxylase (fatty acid hydroxylase superfamily)
VALVINIHIKVALVNTPIPYRPLLGILAAIFALRVAAQFALQDNTWSLLPAFERWHSETVPYSALLGLQLIILAVMAFAIANAPFNRMHPRLGGGLIVLGWVYVGLMTARLIIGALDLIEHPWFDGAVSTAFHFGLAAFVLVLGSALKGVWREGFPHPISRIPRYCAYPALLVGGFALFTWLRQTDSPLLFSSYLSVLIASFGVLLHETFAPAREDWRPTVHDVLNDSLFLSIVQVILPLFLKGIALALIVAVAGSDNAPFTSYWPHAAPVLVQVLGMLVVAEFFRYWLHRALHKVSFLWPLHAVHHASNKLYTVNVGRFHPLDKAIQFLGDTLPFLLLGVAPEVFAAYFVLYAVNGFYQHSNADIRLGPLNWIIAGPELHRWHHSIKLSEAKSNYGNNLIIWDAIFGTRFLPKNREVARIGIGNSAWPDEFPAQMRAPFKTPTDAPKE